MSNLVREQLENYFSSVNPTSKRMMADIMTCRKEYSNVFEALPDDEQSQLIWKSIVKSEAIEKYEKLPANKIETEYFPVLRTRPGEKIIVDDDTASGRSFGCTWRDEHSAPFRWETQSQLDLRFDADELDGERVATLEKDASKEKEKEPEKTTEVRKEEEIKHPPHVKRPAVPPPPVPPHAIPPIPPHIDSPPPERKKDETPIYAKVMKRKSANKTLSISEVKAHRKAKEEMKPAVPPRMSLELKGSVDISKYKTLPIDFEGIPKTGFDFLDNW